MAQAEFTQLNTFINDSIEIDRIGAGPGNANLFAGTDAANPNLPAGGPGDYIDWNDLGGAADIANHRLPDLDLASGKDPTAFPGSDECVGTANVLSKMDLRYIASANNNTYAYFAVLRASNSGDAGYYWLFTRKEPHLIPGGAQCSAAESRLLYDISGPVLDPITGDVLALGDVLLAGHFAPSSDPLLRVFTATQDINNVTAVDAIDFESSLWTLNPNGVAAVAVNTTATAPGLFGSDGVKNMVGANLGTELFAEAAVPLSIFTGDSPCGATFFGSVITRSSGSGATEPDLKDLSGPAIFNFGKPTATAHLEPTCDLDVDFFVDSILGSDGQPLQNPTCLWEFEGGGTSNSCTSGQHTFAAGLRGAKLTVSEGETCEVVIDVDEVNVYPPLGATATMDGSCALSFSFNSTVSGGTGGAVTRAWTFTPPVVTVTPPATLASASGSATVNAPGSKHGALLVTQSRPDVEAGSCTANASADAAVFGPIQVTLSGAAPADACLGDAVTFTASVTGGSGSSTLEWFGAGAGCTGTTCLIDPGDGEYCVDTSLYAVVTDGDAECGSDQSETGNYDKATTVTVSIVP